jgi:hypothetical protein
MTLKAKINLATSDSTHKIISITLNIEEVTNTNGIWKEPMAMIGGSTSVYENVLNEH